MKRMTAPTFDADGYPTEDTLREIREWSPERGYSELLAFMRAACRYPDCWRQRGRTHRVATGGWSGNEELIRALRENHIAWAVLWWESKRGGGYTFKAPPKVKGGEK